MTNKGVKA